MSIIKTPSLKLCLSTFIPAILVLSIVIIANVFFQIDIASMTRDVTVLGHIHPFSGFISSFGILLWCASASICLFLALTLYFFKFKNAFWFLLTSGLLSSYLLIDDFFLFHEFVESRGVGEKVVFVILGIAVLLYLIKFKNFILKTNFSMLLLALIFLSISVLVDSIHQYLWEEGDLHAFIEDGSKFLGIVCWCSYYLDTSYKVLINNFVKK